MTRFKIAALVLTAFFVIAAAAPAGNEESDGAKALRAAPVLRSSVLSAGGSPGTSASFGLQGTLGQPTPVGVGASASFRLHAGFWRKMSVATDVLEGILPVPFKNALFPNMPNPFNPVTTIRYEVGKPAPSSVEIEIYDIRGRLVRTLVREARSSGRHEVTWDGRDDRGVSAASGVYLYRLRIGGFSDVRKMLLVK